MDQGKLSDGMIKVSKVLKKKLLPRQLLRTCNDVIKFALVVMK